MQNGCSLQDLKMWNNLKSDSVSIGQSLIIWKEKNLNNSSLMNQDF
ncbi:MAG: LysM peptidoglycan-binding domain-containing protein [Bacteroidetes bacterium]|nr:LysM peptidoglycan-binding domain-containing protein [Bacteroidota bacterium]